MGSQSSGASFNEEAALEELERLQRAIAESRRQRGESVAEFDAFVRSFKDPALDTRKQPSRPAPVNRTTPATPSPLPPVPAPVAAAEQSEKTGAAPTPAGATSAAVRTRGRRLGVGTLVAGLAGIAAVIVAIVVMINRGNGSGSASPATGSAPVTTSPSSPAPSVAPSSPANAAPGASQGPPPQAEIVTLRPVWLRVTVDGERTIEREVKGNERIPLRARRTIAIRAGDAGAVRMMLNGQDQGLLGRTGEVVSRTFTVPGAAVPPAR